MTILDVIRSMNDPSHTPTLTIGLHFIVECDFTSMSQLFNKRICDSFHGSIYSVYFMIADEREQFDIKKKAALYILERKKNT